ncbi:MAG: protein disulfide oxidoreductase [Methylococcales bacterium]
MAFYILVTSIIFAGQFLMNPGLKTGKPPLISQQTLAGQSAMKMISHGPAIIYFWASWCGICKMMQQPISQVLTDYPIVTVAVKSGNKQAVQNYLTKKRLNWNVVNDPLGSIAEKYQTRGVPSIFFLNKQGEIALTTTGYTSEIGLRLRLWLVSIFDT